LRIFARLISPPFALSGFCLGVLVLMANLGTGSPYAEALLRRLEVFNQWSIDQGLALRPQAYSGFVESASGTLLGLVLVLPAGFGLLAYVVGRVRRAGVSKRAPGSTDAEPPEENGSARASRRAVKRVVKQAEALERQGDPLGAGELLWNHELLDEAAACFIGAGEFVRAAEIRHDQNRFLESAQLHFEGENYESAGSIFAQQEDWAQAAESYLKCDHKSVAAEMFEKAGQYREAAHCYRETEFLRHAAAMYVKCKDWLPAAECLEAVFVEDGGQIRHAPHKAQEMEKLVRQAGKLYLKAEALEKALAIFVRGGCPLEAGETAALMGDLDGAAQYYRQAGKIDRAAEALRSAGQPQEAARLLGQHLRDAGENEQAALMLEEAEELEEAGELYRVLGKYEEAARCFESHRSFSAAAEMHRLAGDRARAGDAFEKAGRYTEAAECFALEGDGPREADLLERAGDFLRSGETYHREGLDEEAIAVLQRVPAEDEDFVRAASMLGDIFASRGQHALAVTKLQQAVGEAELTRENVGGCYRLGVLYQQNGKASEAVPLFEKVMAFDYNYRDVQERLAETRSVVAQRAPVAAKGSGATGMEPPRGTASPDDRYRVAGELGRGGMGIVYKAQDTVLDRLVAFKVLPQALTENEQAITNFMREAQAAAKLNHPNIVTVYDTGEQQGHYYIAMEHVEGTTLKEILRRRGPVSPAGILHVLIQISEALAYAHEKKVVHRDVKPANAMWTRDKTVKLMDFGLAKIVEEARNNTTVVAGTPYYMSPEQTLGKNVDHRTDIYSLGVTAFEMATGTVPFKDGNIPYHHVHTPPPRIDELQPDLPPVLSQIVARCLEKDPAARYQSAREIQAEVRSSLSQVSPEPEPE
jgi:tetratricopeptide (TPR) repeat protein